MPAMRSVGEIEEMSNKLDEEDRKILAAVIFGVDITEMYSQYVSQRWQKSSV